MLEPSCPRCDSKDVRRVGDPIKWEGTPLRYTYTFLCRCGLRFTVPAKSEMVHRTRSTRTMTSIPST